MGSKVVPLRLDDEIIEFIDYLVRLGIYRNRSEALRSLIEIGVRKYRSISYLVKAVDKLFVIEQRKGDIPIRLDGALKQLLAERDRF